MLTKHVTTQLKTYAMTYAADKFVEKAVLGLTTTLLATATPLAAAATPLRAAPVLRKPIETKFEEYK